ncbi:polysaccharide deacetylase family protein [Myxococcaceae bacterium GXIMD 01537]
MPTAPARLARASLPFLVFGLLACKGTGAAPSRAEPPPAAGLAATYSADSGTAAAARPPRDEALARDVADIVTRYRKNIVLGADAHTLDEATRERVTIVGRMLFEENHQHLARLGDRLAEALTASANAPTAPAPVLAFLDLLEKGADLHDADKLAFKDALEDLADAARELPQTPAWKAPLLTRLQEDGQALREIQGLYEKELEKIFGQFETRGMVVRREAWEAYVIFVKTRFTREAILKDFEAALQPLEEGTRGGKAPAPAPRKDEGVLTGASLPPKTLVLTFDDGPHGRRTAAILATLEQFKVKATFFAVGSNVGTVGKDNALKPTPASAQSKKILEAGHVLANHTLTHSFLPKLSDEKLASEIDESRRILETVTGGQVTLFRPPYGAFNEKVRTALSARGLKPYIWNIDSMDWSDPIPKSVANRVVQEVEKYGRGVILMHDIHSQTVEALPVVLETLQARGYRFALWDGTTLQGDGVAQAAPAEPAANSLYRDSWAVVIGINEYQKWPKLSYAVNDAQGVRDLLVGRFRFKPENVQVLLNQEATRERILSTLGDALSDSNKVKRDDRVFVFFAGHGVTRKLPNGRSLGYIVPVDADTANYQSTAISMTNFQDISEAIPAKHVFYVMDACYSGLALTRGANPVTGDVRKYLQEVTRRSTRQVLTAGGADEQVADQGPQGHSIFTWTLLQGLEGQADLNTDGFITASELAAYVGPAVSSVSRQTPAFGSMVGSEGGEFILELNHEGEFLSETSEQLDAQAIQLNAELEKVRKEIEAKTRRNQELAQQLAAARGQLAQLETPTAPAAGGTASATPAAPAPTTEVTRQARLRSDRGMELYREKRYPDALVEFLAASALVPNDAQTANNVGFVQYKLGQYAEAQKWLEKTVALDGQRAVAWLNLGDARDKLGRREEAAQAYRRYLELLPAGPAASTVKAKLTQLGF